jgi:conjugative transfer region protein TrbK
MMRLQIAIRGVAYLVLAVALLATAISLNNRQYPRLQAEPSSAVDNLDAALAHCKALGTEAENDAGCKAVWQASRERFLNAKEPHQGHVPHSLPAASNANEPAGGRPSSPGDRAGQAQ